MLPETLKTLPYRPLSVTGEIPVKMAGKEPMRLFGYCQHLMPGTKVGGSEILVLSELPVEMPGRVDKAVI